MTNRIHFKYIHAILRVMRKAILIIALSATANAAEISMVYESEIFDPKLSYKVLDVVYVVTENSYFLAGTYSVAKSMKGQKHIDGLWVKLVDRHGKELISEKYGFKNEPNRAIVTISRTGEVLFLLEGENKRSFIRFRNEFSVFNLLKSLDLSYVSSIAIDENHQYWVVGQMFDNPKAILLSEDGSVLQEYVEKNLGFFVDINKLGDRIMLLAYEGDKQAYYRNSGKLAVFEALKGKQDKLDFLRRNVGTGKFAIIGSVNGNITLGVDSGVGVSQKIVLRALDNKNKNLWEMEVRNVELGLEQFDFDVTDNFWVITGSERNRTYTVFVSKANRKNIYYYRDVRRLITINNKVACGDKSCLVVGTRVNATKNKTIRNKIALRFFDEPKF